MIYTKSKIYSASAAAKALGISKMTLHRRIKAELIYAQNIGSEERPKYAIHESELELHRLFVLGELAPEDVPEGADLNTLYEF